LELRIEPVHMQLDEAFRWGQYNAHLTRIHETTSGLGQVRTTRIVSIWSCHMPSVHTLSLFFIISFNQNNWWITWTGWERSTAATCKSLSNFRSEKSMHLCRRGAPRRGRGRASVRLHLCWGTTRRRGRRRVTRRPRRRVPRRLRRAATSRPLSGASAAAQGHVIWTSSLDWFPQIELSCFHVVFRVWLSVYFGRGLFIDYFFEKRTWVYLYTRAGVGCFTGRVSSAVLKFSRLIVV